MNMVTGLTDVIKYNQARKTDVAIYEQDGSLPKPVIRYGQLKSSIWAVLSLAT